MSYNLIHSLHRTNSVHCCMCFAGIKIIYFNNVVNNNFPFWAYFAIFGWFIAFKFEFNVKNQLLVLGERMLKSLFCIGKLPNR